jgi:hypothetical protein
MTITLQPAQDADGSEYDPRKPLPYPIAVGDDDRCENVPGFPLRHQTDDRTTLPILVGFMPDLDTQSVEVLADEWRERDVTAVVGMVPVFFCPGGISEGMFNLAVPITDVRVEIASR